MNRRRFFPAALGATAFASFLSAHPARTASRRPGIFSSGQSQTGQGGTSRPRTGAADTDTVARFPDDLFMFETRTGISGSIIEGVKRVRAGASRPANRLVKSDYSGFAPYQDTDGVTVNAATPFLFALTDALRTAGQIPNGLFGFTTWEGGAAINSFLPPDDPDYLAALGVSAVGDNRPDPPTNYENLVAAMARYAELTVAAGYEPYIPMIRFEHGEGRIQPRAADRDLASEKARYYNAHLRMTDALVGEVRRITGQADDPIFLLGGWGGADSATGLIDVAQDSILRLVATRPQRYVGPTSSPYMAPFYSDNGRSSDVHPGFVGRVLVGEAQARAASLCLGDGLTPNPVGFAPLQCIGVTRAPAGGVAYDLTYRLPPGTVGGVAFAVDDLLPPTSNQGFEYQGSDRSRTVVTNVQIVAVNAVRVFLSRLPTDPLGQILYGFLPRENPIADGIWNYRGNLACTTDIPSFYAPILAAPPYEKEIPATLRHVAVQQRVAVPPSAPGPDPRPR